MKLDNVKKFIVGVSGFSVIFLVSVSILAQANNSISGFVFGIQQQPVANVPVELQDDLNRLIARTETNGAGRYSFSRLTRGKYNVKVFTGGTNYQEEIREVEISSIRMAGGGGAETFQQNFYLRMKQNSTAVSTLKNKVIFAQEVPKEAEKSYQKAVSDLDSKKTESGITELKNSLKLFPKYFLALERLADEYIKKEDYKNAFDAANKAVEVNDGSYECWYVVGYSAYQLKNSQEAVKALNKAVLIVPNSINALFVLGANLRQIGKYEESEAAFLKAKKFATSPVADIHWHLALLYTNNLKKYKEAITELELFLKAKPDFAEADKVKDLIKRLKEKVKN